MSSTSSASATGTSSAAATSSSSSGSFSAGGGNLKIVGIILAIASGLLIGSSFVFKKKGLLRSQAGHAAGEGVAYLKSPLWWTGMIMMILGELCNFAAYAFVEAIVVTPLGALSVVICAILSSFFLNEKLSFFGWLGCGLCIIGSVIIALNGPSEQSVGQITEFQKLFLAPGFLVYGSVLIAAALVIIFYFGPRYGKKSMLWWIFVCSMIGGISVSVTTGLGAAIVTTAQGDNQFKHWFIYFLMAFVAVTLITEVYYLNVALALFNTAMVTPTYYVIFTFFSIVTTIVLFQGLKASATSIITLVMGFLVICFGITILQMSKVDPEELSSKLDRRSTILLQAARQQTENEEKSMLGMEDPGMDALRGSLHGTVGSIMRARRISQSSRAGSMYRSRHGSNPPPWSHTGNDSTDLGPGGLTRHQLYDAPMPSPAFSSTTAATRGDLDASSMRSSSFISNTGGAQLPVKKPTIKFGSQDMVHSYHPTNAAAGQDLGATHERRPVPIERGSSDRGLGAPGAVMHGGGGGGGYPPVRTDLTGDSQTMSQLLSAIQESPASDGLPGENNALIFGTRPGDGQTVHSAPPTVAGKFPRGVPARKDSRDVFEGSPISTTMMTFPSVTDSARSWDEQAEEDGRKGNHDTRGRSAKRYPKGAEDQDREESVSLWRRDGKEPEETTDEEGFSPSSPEDYRLTQMGGVRLVGSGSRIP